MLLNSLYCLEALVHLKNSNFHVKTVEIVGIVDLAVEPVDKAVEMTDSVHVVDLAVEPVDRAVEMTDSAQIVDLAVEPVDRAVEMTDTVHIDYCQPSFNFKNRGILISISNFYYIFRLIRPFMQKTDEASSAPESSPSIAGIVDAVQIKILVLPLGKITNEKFNHYFSLLQSLGTIRLSELTPITNNSNNGHQPKSSTSPQASNSLDSNTSKSFQHIEML